MKRWIVLLAALIMALSLTACFGVGNNGATADEAKAGDISSYSKDFDGLMKYVADSTGGEKFELYYGIIGADNGARYVMNNNPYVEVYDFSSVVDDNATADSADPAKAKEILEDIKDDGKFRPVADGIEMTAVITDSGRYVIAWDETRSYDYTGKIATDDMKANW